MASNRTRVIFKTIFATLAVSAVLGAAGGYAVFKSGWYNIGANNQHYQITHTFLEQGMRESVQFYSRDVVVPQDIDSTQRVRRGAVVYRDHCVQCHGGPGAAQADFGRSMQPVPGPLIDASRRWPSAQLYWITKNGIKMSGMPAWEFHLADEDLWSAVAFLRRLPALTVPAYRDMMALEAAPAARAPASNARGDIARGRVALAQYACVACHMIPGVTGSEVYVGRPLKDLDKRKFIAGHLPNTQENLIRWIRNPQSVDPETAMPMLDVTEADALDISAYLLAPQSRR